MRYSENNNWWAFSCYMLQILTCRHTQACRHTHHRHAWRLGKWENPHSCGISFEKSRQWWDISHDTPVLAWDFILWESLYPISFQILFFLLSGFLGIYAL
jgi:hypothetical protein